MSTRTPSMPVLSRAAACVARVSSHKTKEPGIGFKRVITHHTSDSIIPQIPKGQRTHASAREEREGTFLPDSTVPYLTGGAVSTVP